jgi:hypothetical protein
MIHRFLKLLKEKQVNYQNDFEQHFQKANAFRFD